MYFTQEGVSSFLVCRIGLYHHFNDFVLAISISLWSFQLVCASQNSSNYAMKGKL